MVVKVRLKKPQMKMWSKGLLFKRQFGKDLVIFTHNHQHGLKVRMQLFSCTQDKNGWENPKIRPVRVMSR